MPTYDVAYGKHKPACGGECLLADVGSLNLMPLSAALILVPCTFWFGFVAPYLCTLTMGPLAVVLLALTMVTSLTFLILAWATEPGIVPFVPVEEKESEDQADGKTVLKRNKRKRYMIALNGQHFPLPMLRAKICRETKACVERFDHFCPWVGNVVGARNQRYFVLFTIFTALTALLTFSTSLYHSTSSVNIRPFYERAVALLLVSYSAVILLAVGGLMCYHVDLISQNQSTNEKMKGTYSIRRNPHDKGFSANCYEFWCLPIRASYIAMDNKDDDIPLPLLQMEEGGNN